MNIFKSSDSKKENRFGAVMGIFGRGKKVKSVDEPPKKVHQKVVKNDKEEK